MSTAPSATPHTVIIGAGIVGACTALELLKAGHRVTLLEPGLPGGEQAASYGNGCWLSPASVIPPALPGLWRKVPGFLSDPLGPLAIRWSYFPKVLPWLLRYLASGWTEARVQRTAVALRALVQGAPALHAALAEAAGVGHLIQRHGLLYIYPDRRDFEAEALAWRIRRAVGVQWVELSAEELRQREPELDPRYTFALLVEEGGHCLDPGAYVAALVALAESEGAERVTDRATGFRIEGGRLRAVLTPNGELACDRAVIAAGAYSKQLAAAAGDRVPLETERGYHAMIQGAEIGPRTPMMPSDGKMSITMTAGGLRCAGQVEIAGLEAAPNWRRAEILRDHLLRSFPGLPRDLPAERMRFWMGHRPSMPDGLPCLGPSRATPDIVHAFGHGHVGLAAAPRSAQLVMQILTGQPVAVDTKPYDAARF
ncbi:FAD-binding oxidoreductase [Siccirubricoccus sp. KC 17139]|uniref:FAD-binding oxidoreductase n=1 Tax=Siccirubricoccus soli TaxID=2899147 RepID=A0ABT1DCN6_9PROT|nr:FAD-binding oxidoreductase [Siccirubricoccus soli]MCO6419701.1 FAD-binding oxidoreductase [Siccirubricoccus soli]MCP2685836.1 FAD-binding oxidoreductase [Siccirubricoccus soli]